MVQSLLHVLLTLESRDQTVSWNVNNYPQERPGDVYLKGFSLATTSSKQNLKWLNWFVYCDKWMPNILPLHMETHVDSAYWVWSLESANAWSQFLF